MKILSIGGATYDIFLTTGCLQTTTINQDCFVLLQEGRKIDVESIRYCSGGGATNSATLFARLGFQAHAIFKIGDDCAGAFIQEQLRKEGVVLHHAVAHGSATGCSVIMPCPSGDRTVLVYRGVNLLLNQQDISLDLLAQQDQIYISSLTGQSAALLGYVATQAKQRGIPVAVNPGSHQLQKNVRSLYDALPAIDILILNSYEMQLCMQAIMKIDYGLCDQLQKRKPPNGPGTMPALLTKLFTHNDMSFNLYDFFAAIHARGVKIIAVTDGACGVYAASAGTVLFHPSLSVPVLNTVGAGDAFASCFVAQLARGQSIEYAMRAGIINSASVIQCSDAKEGLLDQAGIDAKMAELNQALLQRFEG
ncbi:MAG TPA: carbohydrate kinase family protein [Candidatus Babeliales bacterium]|nr:carbohydrate kinase family protein [Candidatus Babeliales bacterium]